MVRGVEMHHSNNKTFKDITKLQQQKNCRPVSQVNIDKSPQQNISKPHLINP